MADSQSKQFGDQFLGKLGNQLDKKAPVFNQSLFAGAGDATKNAWNAGTGNATALIASGGLTDPMKSAMGTFGGLVPSWGNANAGQDARLRAVSAGYGALGDNNGLTADQASAIGNYGGLAGTYGGLATAYDPNSSAYQTLRSKLQNDTATGIYNDFNNSGLFGSDANLKSAGEGITNALAGLDYTNMQNDINNRYRAADSQAGIYSNLFGMGQTGVGNQLSALGGQANAANSIFANNATSLGGQQNAATSLFSAGQTGIGNKNAAVDALTQIGAAKDANTQGALLGKADLYDRTKNAELDRLAKIGAIFGDPTAAANQPNWWQSGLGALLGLGGSALSGGAFGG